MLPRSWHSSCFRRGQSHFRRTKIGTVPRSSLLPSSPPIAVIRRAGPFGRDHRCAPSGRSGVQRMPKAGQSQGRRWPCNTSPAMHSAGSSAVIASTPKRRSASKRCVGRPQSQAAGGNLADPPPLPSTGSKTSRICCMAGRLPSGRTLRAYWLSHLRPARSPIARRTGARPAGCPAARSPSRRWARGTAGRWGDTRPCR